MTRPRELSRPAAAGLWNGGTRAGIVIFGGLFALQSSDQLSALKMLYLVVASIAVAGSVRSVWIHRDDRSIRFVYPWILVSVVILALIVVSLPVAWAHNTPWASWLRDASAYGLLAMSPWVALDLGTTVGRRNVLAMLVVAGGLGVAAFVVDWVQRRGLADLPIDRLALSSFALAGAFYCVAFALSVTSSRLWTWTAIAAAILVALLVTGTRSSVVILAGPGALLLAALRSDRVHLAKIGAMTAVQVLVIALVLLVSLRGSLPIGSPAPSSSPGLPTLVPTTSALPPNESGTQPASSPAATESTAAGPEETAQPDVLAKRFGTLADILAGRDASFRERIEQSVIAWHAFTGSPIVGVGLGYDFALPPTIDGPRHQFTLDSPVLVFAKFGVLALLLLAALSGAFWFTLRDLVRQERWSWVTQSLIAYSVLLVMMLPFGWPLEDKGTGLVLILLLGAAFARPHQSEVPLPEDGLVRTQTGTR
jgi:hypothetical protein